MALAEFSLLYGTPPELSIIIPNWFWPERRRGRENTFSITFEPGNRNGDLNQFNERRISISSI